MPEYSEYCNLIYKRAHQQAAENQSLEFDDLVGLGNLAFCEALCSWDSTKGCFSTHLWWKIRHRFSRANKKTIKKDLNTARLDDAMQLESKSNPFSDCAFKTGLENLGNEASEVCSLIFNSSLELCNLTQQTIQVTRDNVRHYLESKGWAKETIDLAFREIRTMLKGL